MRRSKLTAAAQRGHCGEAYLNLIKPSVEKPESEILPFLLRPEGLTELALPEFLVWRDLDERKEQHTGMEQDDCLGRSGRSQFVQASRRYCMTAKWTEDESGFHSDCVEIDTLL